MAGIRLLKHSKYVIVCTVLICIAQNGFGANSISDVNLRERCLNVFNRLGSLKKGVGRYNLFLGLSYWLDAQAKTITNGRISLGTNLQSVREVLQAGIHLIDRLNAIQVARINGHLGHLDNQTFQMGRTFIRHTVELANSSLSQAEIPYDQFLTLAMDISYGYSVLITLENDVFFGRQKNLISDLAAGNNPLEKMVAQLSNLLGTNGLILPTLEVWDLPTQEDMNSLSTFQIPILTAPLVVGDHSMLPIDVARWHFNSVQRKARNAILFQNFSKSFTFSKNSSGSETTTLEQIKLLKRALGHALH